MISQGKRLNRKIFWFALSFFAVFFLSRFYLSLTLAGVKGEKKLIKLSGVLLPPEEAVPTSDARPNQKLLTVEIPKKFVDQVSLYQVDNYLSFIGPKGWRGKAWVATDGNIFVSLSPEQGQDEKYYLKIKEIPACVSCALSAASPFFKEAKKIYKETYQADSLPNRYPLILKHRISPNLIVYTYPSSLIPFGGFCRKGVVLFNFEPEISFWQIEVSLPSSQKDFVDFLLNQFIKMHTPSNLPS